MFTRPLLRPDGRRCRLAEVTLPPPAPSTEAWDFVVDRADPRRHAVRDAAPAALRDGEVRLRVEAYALTANTLTYAVTGDRFHYWDLFPAGDGWGRVPAWGIASVESSADPDVTVGARFTGMVPMSTHLVVAPQATRDGFVDRSPHRADLDPVYNRYVRVDGRADDDLERDAALRPVFVLSFVLAEHLRTTARRGATRLLVTSASSKAALGLAHVLSGADVTVVGLTSATHLAEVEATGFFDGVVDYDHVDALPTAARSVLVDVTGNRVVRDAVARHLGTSLVDTLRVGQTDWDRPVGERLGDDGGSAFFAPTALRQLVSDWGAAVFRRRFGDALQSFTAHSHLWLSADRREGRGEVGRAFEDVLDGAVAPHRFVVVRPTGVGH